jgi:hypothetical protein
MFFCVHSGVSSAAIKSAQKILQTPSGVYSYFLIFCSSRWQKKHLASAAWSSKPDVPVPSDGFARTKTKVLLAAESRLLWKSSITLHSDIAHTHSQIITRLCSSFVRRSDT